MSCPSIKIRYNKRVLDTNGIWHWQAVEIEHQGPYSIQKVNGKLKEIDLHTDVIVPDMNCEIGRIDIGDKNVYYNAKVIEKAWQLIEEARGE